ncbi:MAG: hypothetical protein ATN35_01125 [Epulopiscium sp. Nele67-Bin004]|nr:MAG: hypothetical protein ATN35_01125 [Epulopiscium sp. Nele67-Bin004]
MRFEKNNKYFNICIYTITSVIVVALLIVCMLKLDIILDGVFGIIRRILSMFTPLFIGFFIAYLVDPFVDVYLGKIKYIGESKKRAFATLFAIITIICIFGLFIMMIVMNMRNVLNETSIENIAETINAYLEMFNQSVENMVTSSNVESVSAVIRQLLTKIYSFIDGIVNNFTQGIVDTLTALGESVIDIVLGIIIAVYLILDKPKLLKIWNNILKIICKNKLYKELTEIGRAINTVMTGYIRGQILDALTMAILTSIVLTIIGLDFAVIIGVVAGVFNIIPYFGPIVGLVLAGVIGAVGAEPQKGLYAIIAVLALQQLDAWVIVPKIIGENVKLHPIVVLLAIVVGGELFGIWGMLAGVPVVALIRVVIIRYFGNIFSPEYEV